MVISLAAEPIFSLAGFTVTNSTLTTALVSLLLVLGFLAARVTMARVPGKIQAAAELLYSGLLSTTEKVIGRADVAREIFPFIITAFFFIVASNWSGLIPGFGSITTHFHGHTVPIFRAPTSDLNTVIALALCSVAYVQYLGIKHRGAGKYLGTFFNFSSPIYFFVGLIELISELIRPISYSFRLFGNIFAGEVLLAVMLQLTSTLLPLVPIIPVPFFILEMFVGVIQGFVFCFLTIVFTSIAVVDHGDSHGAAKAVTATSNYQ